MSELYVRNRQHTRLVDLKRFRAIAETLVARICPDDFQLGIVLVAAPEMTRLNETFLRHAGSTDVIAFDYSEKDGGHRQGELFLCVDEALAQARRFRTTWQAELVRYLIHGLLHLRGYDDSTPRSRQRMKSVENRLMQTTGREFCLSQLERRPRVRA